MPSLAVVPEPVDSIASGLEWLCRPIAPSGVIRLGYWLVASSSRPLSEPCSIGVDNDGKDDNATGDHLPHKISNAHQD